MRFVVRPAQRLALMERLNADALITNGLTSSLDADTQTYFGSFGATLSVTDVSAVAFPWRSSRSSSSTSTVSWNSAKTMSLSSSTSTNKTWTSVHVQIRGASPLSSSVPVTTRVRLVSGGATIMDRDMPLTFYGHTSRCSAMFVGSLLLPRNVESSTLDVYAPSLSLVNDESCYTNGTQIYMLTAYYQTCTFVTCYSPPSGIFLTLVMVAGLVVFFIGFGLVFVFLPQ